MNRQCGAIKASGERCRGVAVSDGDFCPSHDPRKATERRRNAARAGRTRPNQEIKALKEEIRTIIAGVKAGHTDRADSSVMFQGYRTLKDFIQLERDVSMIPELTDRLEDLKRERRYAG